MKQIEGMGPKPKWWPGVWFYAGPFFGVRPNVLPWLGSDGTFCGWNSPEEKEHMRRTSYCRRTIVIPFLGLGAMVVGLRWHPLVECSPEGFAD